MSAELKFKDCGNGMLKLRKAKEQGQEVKVNGKSVHLYNCRDSVTISASHVPMVNRDDELTPFLNVGGRKLLKIDHRTKASLDNAFDLHEAAEILHEETVWAMEYNAMYAPDLDLPE